MQQRKYMNISRLKTKDLPGFRVGDYIVVQEKIDGANFSIRYDRSRTRYARLAADSNWMKSITFLVRGSGHSSWIRKKLQRFLEIT